MANHSQKWHDDTTSRNIRRSSNKDRLAALVNKLDNLGRDMKKLKESVHAIQSFNRSNGGKFRVRPPGYYTKIDNHPLYAEKRQSLKELLAKHQEESAQRSTEMEVWIKKLQENAEINTRNQSASINVMPRSIFKHLHLTNLRKTNMLCEMADMSKKAPLGIVENVLVKIGKFLFLSDFVIIDNTPSKTTIQGRHFLATIRAEIDVFTRKMSLGINGDRISFDSMRNSHKYTNPSERIFMVIPQSPA
ncbi:putative reverse transcriptase domain-containing protein [Tanacetum coccineum]